MVPRSNMSASVGEILTQDDLVTGGALSQPDSFREGGETCGRRVPFPQVARLVLCGAALPGPDPSARQQGCAPIPASPAMPRDGITFAGRRSRELRPDISGELARDDEPSTRRREEMRR